MTKLQAALVGNVKSIRTSSGYDITETTIGEKAKELGVERPVRQLNQMEKRLLRIIVLMDQMRKTGAMGDFAKTIEQPANQLKILSNQFKELGMWLGNVFMKYLGDILPYVNAVVMVLKELAKMLALLVGYENVGTVTGGIEEGTEEINSNLGGAVANAKELKKTLMGFDVLNVIQTPSSSSGGAGSVSGVDPAIMDAMREYENLMSGVTMRATQIRDRIMEWLGFTKHVNKETGEVTWSLNDGYTNLEKIRDIVKVIGFLFLTWKVTKLLTVFKDIFKLFSGNKLIKTVAGLGESFLGWIKGGENSSFACATLKKQIGLIASGVKAFAQAFGAVALIIGGVIELFKGIKALFNKEYFEGVAKTITGIALIVAGVAVAIAAWPVALVAAIVAVVGILAQIIAKNWDTISAFFTKLGTAFKTHVIDPIVNFFKPFGKWIYDHVIKPVIDFFAPIFEAIGSVFKYAIDSAWDIVKGIGEAIWSIITKIGEIFLKIVEIFVALGKAAWTYIFKPIFDYIGKIAKWLYDNAIKPILNFFADVGKWVYNKIIKPVYDWIVWVKDKAVDLFKKVGTTVVTFVSNAFKSVINGILSAVEKTINSFIRMLNGAIGIINEIPGVNITKVNLLNIPRLATGGFPDAGQMFVAREAGPELVGTIGSKSAVVNNDQIVEAVSQGVAQAVSSVMGSNGGSFNLYIDGQQITDVVTRRMSRMANITGGYAYGQ
jgi:phage-related protein